jgi:protein phosphatase
LEAAGLDDIGLERDTHEDVTFVDEARGLFVVVDGMGMYGGGVWASRMVREHLDAWIGPDALYPDAPDAPERQMVAWVREVNARVREKAREHLAWTNSGATVVVGWVRGGWLWLTHVGDCRAYLRRDGVLSALTRDHNLANAFLEQGLSPPWAVEQDHFQHIVTRAIGVGEHADVDVSRRLIEPGDELLLCSDGVHRDLDDLALAHALERAGGDPKRACELLREAFLSGPAPDNMAAVVARVVQR